MTLLTFLHTLNLWLHLCSLALWIGSIFFFLFVFGPAVHSLSPATGVRLLDRGRRSLELLSWIAIHLLLLTGVFNFVWRGLSVGFDFGLGYLVLLALKLALFFAMSLHHFLQAVKYGPRIGALTEQTPAEIQDWPEPLLSYWKKWFMLLKINAVLGPIILLLGLGLSGR